MHHSMHQLCHFNHKTNNNSHMQLFVDNLVKQSTNNGMKVNQRKTKEMLIRSNENNQLLQLILNRTRVERVSSFKLLGVHVASILKWTQHVDALSSKVSTRLHFLKLLKRSGASINDLVCFYTSVVRPVLEYACLVWHSSLTAGQPETLRVTAEARHANNFQPR